MSLSVECVVDSHLNITIHKHKISYSNILKVEAFSSHNFAGVE